jgi:ABC-type uncharacterized transport system substrate-binding protein
MLALLVGCATAPTPEPPVTAQVKPPPAPVVQPIEPAEPVETAHVAIVLSNEIPAYVSIANQLGRQLGEGNYSIHNMQGNPAKTARMLNEIRLQNTDQVVAIGLLAAKTGLQLDNTPVVFCQTFNYSDHNLISARSKGVSLLPPFDLQFSAWRELAPNLHSVGVITGPNQGQLIKQIRKDADSKNIEILNRTVHSDKEALVEFKRLMPSIQGLMLLPDNRVLSPAVLREIMSYSAKYRTQVVVYSPRLLQLGALMSAANSEQDVAATVIKRLSQISGNGTIAGPDILSLSEARIRINPAIAKMLGLEVPQQLAQLRKAN